MDCNNFIEVSRNLDNTWSSRAYDEYSIPVLIGFGYSMSEALNNLGEGEIVG